MGHRGVDKKKAGGNKRGQRQEEIHEGGRILSLRVKSGELMCSPKERGTPKGRPGKSLVTG